MLINFQIFIALKTLYSCLFIRLQFICYKIIMFDDAHINSKFVFSKLLHGKNGFDKVFKNLTRYRFKNNFDRALK